MYNTFKNILNPNLEYYIKEFSMQPYFNFDVNKEHIISIQFQRISEVDVSKNKDGEFIRKINCFIVLDSDSNEKWLFDGNTCLNKKEVPNSIKKAFEEFKLLIPTF